MKYAIELQPDFIFTEWAIPQTISVSVSRGKEYVSIREFVLQKLPVTHETQFKKNKRGTRSKVGSGDRGEVGMGFLKWQWELS